MSLFTQKSRPTSFGIRTVEDDERSASTVLVLSLIHI
jgi:hypothetical protein